MIRDLGPTRRVPGWLIRLAAAGLIGLCAACSPAPQNGTEPLATARPTSELSVEPGPSPVPQDTPAAASSPAPTADGPLDQKAFPNPMLGFRSVPGQASEGEYQPNGTWVHAIDPAQASMAAFPTCGEQTVPPAAHHALAATYADGTGRPGNGLALEFVDGDAARGWHSAYITRLQDCSAAGDDPVTVRDLEIDPDGFSARRHQATDGHDWTEAGRLRDARVTLVIIAGEHDGPALRRLLG